MTRYTALGLATFLLAAGRLPNELTPIPSGPANTLQTRCLVCHSAAVHQAGINLEHSSIDWTSAENRALWERVMKAVEQGRMPPSPIPPPQPAERDELVSFLSDGLARNTPFGGHLPRRLNSAEYAATIRSLFDYPQFELPMGFPPDMVSHGFDNVSEGLTLSPPLMEAYANTAWDVADFLFPPPRPEAKQRSWDSPPEDMVISFSASTLHDGVLRLVSRSIDIMRSCTWPSRVEIMDAGTYRITLTASEFRPKTEEPMQLEVYAREITASDRSKIQAFRLLKTIEVTSETPETFTFDADLYPGQTPLLRWENAELDHTPEKLVELYTKRFTENPRYLAAYLKAMFDENGKQQSVARLRGRNGHEIIHQYLEDPSLDMSNATMDSELTKRLMKVIDSIGGMQNLGDTLAHEYHDNGPALQIHDLKVEGPIAIVDGPDDKQRKKIRRELAGAEPESLPREEYARRTLARLLPKAFHGPVDDATIERYLAIATEHWAQGHTFDEGMHLLLRNVLISPRFLYRGLHEGPLDDYGLATRLSYFLRLAPPDDELLAAARAGKLTDPKELRAQAERLMPNKPNDAMIRSFTGQWLDMRKLASIMPDPKLKFSEADVSTARQEVEQFFTAMLNENRPMTDFIDPDFTFTSKNFAVKIYEFEGHSEDTAEGRKVQRLPMARGGRYGGLLGQSGVMIATANGVDTQPVLRGVWILDRILGMPPPPPPKNVPALTPDVNGAKTPRELLAAHTKDASCAGCHKQIDPFGFVMENFDPVGRWREEWPKSNAPIESAVTLPDGTPAQDVTDLKRWLVGHIDYFSTCFSEKLMTYATGRVPNFAEQKELEAIVRANRETATARGIWCWR
ncbi:MAG: DUF1588 domain-containing protein [Bryobacterales bacterium]